MRQHMQQESRCTAGTGLKERKSHGFAQYGELDQYCHRLLPSFTNYVDNNSTLTMCSNFLEAKHFLSFEFIPIKPLAATDSSVPGSCAGHNRVPSPDHGCLASTGVSGLSRYDTA